MLKSFTKIFSIFLICLLITSCRLDVVEPEKIESEINQPNQESRLNYLSYELNAENYSFNSVIPLNFSVSKSTIFMTLLSHSNGSIRIEIKNLYEDVVFRTELFDNLPSYSRNFSVSNFSRATITTKDFTGKFKVMLTPLIE